VFVPNLHVEDSTGEFFSSGTMPADEIVLRLSSRTPSPPMSWAAIPAEPSPLRGSRPPIGRSALHNARQNRPPDQTLGPQPET
jgi:hypothetical protein